MKTVFVDRNTTGTVISDMELHSDTLSMDVLSELSSAMPLYNSTETSQGALTLANISDQLRQINDKQAMVLLPAMIVIGCLMVIGLTGNSLVCYIFSKKFKTTTQTTLFLALACFDLVTCSIAMPFEILDLRFFYMFESAIACKIFRSVEAFPTLASNQVLLLIAIDRYRKVCHPLKTQLTPLVTRKLVAVFILISIVFTIPPFFINGMRSASTKVPGIIGSDCATSDAMKNTVYPLIYDGVLAMAFVCFVVVLTILYCFIWKASRRKSFTKTVFRYGQCRSLISEKSSSDGTPKTPKCYITSDEWNDVSSRVSYLRINRTRTNKSTIIAFAVTTVFFLSFLPHLGLVIGKNVAKDFDYHLTDSELVAFNIFIRSFFVNAVANPVIYALMNVRFRFECSMLLKRIIRCCSCVSSQLSKPKQRV